MILSKHFICFFQSHLFLFLEIIAPWPGKRFTTLTACRALTENKVSYITKHDLHTYIISLIISVMRIFQNALIYSSCPPNKMCELRFDCPYVILGITQFSLIISLQTYSVTVFHLQMKKFGPRKVNWLA